MVVWWVGMMAFRQVEVRDAVKAEKKAVDWACRMVVQTVSN